MHSMIERYNEAWDELTAPGAQFATTTIEVRGVPIKVFESALPSMRSVWEMARGYGDRDYVVYEDEELPGMGCSAPPFTAVVKHPSDRRSDPARPGGLAARCTGVGR